MLDELARVVGNIVSNLKFIVARVAGIKIPLNGGSSREVKFCCFRFFLRVNCLLPGISTHRFLPPGSQVFPFVFTPRVAGRCKITREMMYRVC